MTLQRRLGRWQLEEPIGQGGMGQVWRASDGTTEAAVKFIGSFTASTNSARRFEREARLLMRLSHRNIVQALDVGLSPDGVLFVAMELLQGESLAQRVKNSGPIPVREALNVGIQAAEGLGAAHGAGVVHRDVKPGNIFLCHDGTVKVLDFGVAIRAEGRRHNETRLTLGSAIVGTPSFMAPEQATGQRQEDPRTDVWGLGAVLYTALAGRPPFRSDKGHVAEIVRILKTKPDPLGNHVPAGVQEIVYRALRKGRRNRWASMEAFARALRHSREEVAPGMRTIAPPAPLVAEPEAATLDGESRLVSAVLAQGLRGPAALTGFIQEMKLHGGDAEALQGDGAVAIFGGETWMGDEPERAVRAAMAAARHVSYVAVGTNKALVRASAPGRVTGSAVEAATSVLEEAIAGLGAETLPPNWAQLPAQVHLCAETARRVQGRFALVGNLVERERRGVTAPGIRDVGGVEVPLVGRDVELDLLASVVARSVEEGVCRTAIVEGPPGIGKSRLVLELKRRLSEATQRYYYLEGRADSGRQRSPWAWVRDLLRRRAELPEGTPAEQARPAVEELVRGALPNGSSPHTTVFIGEVLGVPMDDGEPVRAARGAPSQMVPRVQNAVSDLFEGWLSRQPVVLVIEDAQWIDEASLALIELLRVRFQERPLTVFVLARPELRRTNPDAFVDGQLLYVRELPQREIARIVEALLGHPAEDVVEGAGGNPFFAEELSLAVRAGTSLDAIPQTVEGAVQARLDALRADEKTLLKRAAVVGQTFWREALVALGQHDAEAVLPSLRRRALVIPRPSSSLQGSEQWSFRHRTVRDVCYGLLTPEQRQSLHRLAAQWLAEQPDAPASEVAGHFEEAGFDLRAAVWHQRAARESRTALALEDSVSHYEHAITAAANATSKAPLDLSELRAELASVLLDLGRVVSASRIAMAVVADVDMGRAAGIAWRVVGQAASLLRETADAMDQRLDPRECFERSLATLGDAEDGERERTAKEWLRWAEAAGEKQDVDRMRNLLRFSGVQADARDTALDPDVNAAGYEDAEDTHPGPGASRLKEARFIEAPTKRHRPSTLPPDDDLQGD